jgi:hypothetical protein
MQSRQETVEQIFTEHELKGCGLGILNQDNTSIHGNEKKTHVLMCKFVNHELPCTLKISNVGKK